MVKQYRIGIAGYTLEVPGGVIDPQDLNDEIAAVRELTEETGYCPVLGAKCLHLGWTFPNPAIMDNKCHSYVIGPVKKTLAQKLDPGEMIEVVEIPIAEIPERILKGEINHALMLNTFFFLALGSKITSTTLVNELSQFVRPQRSDKG
jgi:8-oxo-dGTP pyrophosphatase MutT (NUDIX family)